jgi:hypothetical protein
MRLQQPGVTRYGALAQNYVQFLRSSRLSGEGSNCNFVEMLEEFEQTTRLKL